MKNIFIFLIANLWMTITIACEVKDDMGTKIHLLKPAQRIITLAPDITEIVFAIGAGQHIVGTILASDYPKSARRIPVVGSYNGLDIEKMLSLKPDLIIAWGTYLNKNLRIFKQLHIPIYINHPTNLEDVARTIKNLGCITHTASAANQLAERYLEKLIELRKRYQNQNPLSVFYQLGAYSLMTVNKNTWINQAITLCGGKNIFADAITRAPEVSFEAVLAGNPQVILCDTQQENCQSRWQAFKELTAVKQNHVFSLQPDLINRAGPRLLQGISKMCEYLQQARSI